ncbi:hypothetical protein I1A62_01395 (plasmid) [Rhodococcus sp. USK10]|uniref:hypothetical protein n=1 Tax=Rhodococcus sp. USK10 TaxID=2789739 RepID=UPI001C6012EE|nr:hypothetical protein [Rhodococcus sp. USK10]QYA99848.1 hypothetical protein I1A62_01395 [Rhodococcus sp. USK10]
MEKSDSEVDVGSDTAVGLIDRADPRNPRQVDENAESVATRDEPGNGATWTALTHGRKYLAHHKAFSATMFVLVAAIVATSVVTATLWGRLQDANRADARRAAVLDVARDTSIGLTSIKADTAQSDIDHVLSMATGAFRDQFAQQAATVTQMVSDSKVDSVGNVIEAGIVHEDPTSAQVLTAVTATVKNAQAPDGEQRHFRMRISLAQENDHWMISNLEFVA